MGVEGGGEDGSERREIEVGGLVKAEQTGVCPDTRCNGSPALQLNSCRPGDAQGWGV